MGTKVKTVKETAAKIQSGALKVSAAVAAIKEARLVRDVTFHMPAESDQMFDYDIEDGTSVAENDVFYFDVLRSAGTISPTEFDELVAALNTNHVADGA